MTLLSREGDESRGATQGFDSVLQLPYLGLPLLLSIQAQGQRASHLRDLRGQALIIGSQRRCLLGHVGVQCPELFTLLLELGQSRFIRLLVRLHRHVVRAEGFALLSKPVRVLKQAGSFGGPLLLSAPHRLELGPLISLLPSHPLVERRQLSQELLAPRQDMLKGGRPRRLGSHPGTTSRRPCAGGSGLSRGATPGDGLMGRCWQGVKRRRATQPAFAAAGPR